MPYLTTRKNLKLQLSPGLVATYDIQPGNGVGLFWYTKHTHTYLLTYLLSPHPHGQNSYKTWLQVPNFYQVGVGRFQNDVREMFWLFCSG